ncbi:MAG: hypothetical protein ACR2HG_05770 [Pyrinomonadaceae bacterium]
MVTAAIVFVIFLAATAAITFFVLRRAVKLAIRAAIVAMILAIAVVGGASLWWFGSTSAKQPVTIKKSR